MSYSLGDIIISVKSPLIVYCSSIKIIAIKSRKVESKKISNSLIALALSHACKGNYEKAMQRFQKNLAFLRSIAPVETIAMEGAPFSRFDNRELWGEEMRGERREVRDEKREVRDEKMRDEKREVRDEKMRDERREITQKAYNLQWKILKLPSHILSFLYTESYIKCNAFFC